MKIVLLLSCIACWGQTSLGSRTAAAGSTMDFSATKFLPGAIVFASLPSASGNTNVAYLVTDCATAACTAGSGTVRAWKISDGSSWNTIGGSVTVPGSSGDIIYNNSGAFGARTPQGNGTTVQMSTGGPYASGLLATFDANSNVVGGVEPTNCATTGQATSGINGFGAADGCFIPVGGVRCAAANATGAITVNWATAGTGSIPCTDIVLSVTGVVTGCTFSNWQSSRHSVDWRQGGTAFAVTCNPGVERGWCTVSTNINTSTHQLIAWDGTNPESDGCPSDDPSVIPVVDGGSGAATLTGILQGNGTSPFTAITPGTGVVAALGVNVGSTGAPVLYNGAVAGATYATATNCADSAGAAACGSAAAGHFVIDAASTSTVVSTTAVTANSEINVTVDSSLGTLLSVTCNTQGLLTLGPPKVTARTAGTSFTVSIEVGPTTNPLCLGYSITN